MTSWNDHLCVNMFTFGALDVPDITYQPISKYRSAEISPINNAKREKKQTIKDYCRIRKEID